MKPIRTTRKQRFPHNRILDALGLPQTDPNSTLCVCGHRKQDHMLFELDDIPEMINCMGEDCDCDKFMGVEENDSQ